MSFNYPKSGPNNAPQYQMSGIPFVYHASAPVLSTDPTTTLEVSLDYVSKDITVINTHGSNNLRVAFTARGPINSGPQNYLVVPAGETIKYDFRCKSIFFMSSAGTTTPFTLIAGLTTIPASNFPILTGSINGTSAFEGVG